MSKKGENVFKRKDGRWEARYEKERMPDGKIRYGYCYGKTYREAKEKKALAMKKEPDRIAPDRRDLAYFAKSFLGAKRYAVKESTFNKYSFIVDRYIVPEFGGYRPAAIPDDRVIGFTDRLTQNNLSAKTIKDILTVFKAILTFAARSAGGGNSLSLLTFPRVRPPESKTLSAEQQSRMIRYLLKEPDRVKLGIVIALFTGIRVGELSALREDHLFLDRGSLLVSATMQRLQTGAVSGSHGTKIVISDPKSEKSNRMIPLPSSLVSLLRPWMTGKPEAFFLTGSEHEIVEPRVLQYRFKKYAVACGIEDAHFHMLRHTFATTCVELGFDVKTLSEILGHSSPRITLERYVHSSYAMKEENMNKLARLLS